MKNTTIRNAEFRDAAAIFGLIRANPKEVLPRPISDIVQSIDRFLVCEEKGEVIGAVSWQILPEMAAGKDPAIEIKSLVVAESARGRGIGGALAKAAIKRAGVFRPAEIIVLTFYPDFFRRLGFKEVPKEGLMHKLYTGCINCTKYDSPFTCPEVAMILR